MTTNQMDPGVSMERLAATRALLVLDDEPQICRMMERCLKDYFDEIITTTDPISAHAILEERRITHVLSDLHIGDLARGFQLVTLWRREFPGIERAVIFTAECTLGLRPPAEVDAVVSKIEGVGAVLEALTGEEYER